jgi:hypothetical protein
MYAGKSYRLLEFLSWTRRDIYVLIVLGVDVVEPPVAVHRFFATALKTDTIALSMKPLSKER